MLINKKRRTAHFKKYIENKRRKQVKKKQQKRKQHRKQIYIKEIT